MKWHLAHVSKICVFDVLCQPILCEVDPSLSHGDCQPSHGGKESIVLVNMLVLLFIRVGSRLREQLLLMIEMVHIALHAGLNKSSIIRIIFNISDT